MNINIQRVQIQSRLRVVIETVRNMLTQKTSKYLTPNKRQRIPKWQINNGKSRQTGNIIMLHKKKKNKAKT